MMADAKLASERVVAERYALFDEIGVGGMATVHIGRLRGAAGFTRTVAIKRLHPSFVRDPVFVSMLIDEARLASRIRHPNVVQTLDVVVDKRELFVVMEYIHGESLANLMHLTHERQIRIPCGIAATIIVDVLNGLHAAHETKDERGQSLELVHRDISPQNIVVGTDGLARVLDFGIAKSATSLHVSQLGVLKGKFSYVAPEQIGEHDVRRQTDIYSASVVLWEVLTGQRLFQGDSPEATLGRVLASDIRVPSHVTKDLPRAFDAVVLRGLARNPARRYESAKAMAAALEKCCTLESHSAVANWLVDVAADALNHRAECIARVERDVESNQGPDLQELVGQLVRLESVRPAQRPTLVDELSAKAQGANRAVESKFSGTVSLPASRPSLRGRKRLVIVCAAVAVTAAMVALLVTQAKLRSRSVQSESRNAQATAIAAPDLSKAQPIITSTGQSASVATSSTMPVVDNSETPKAPSAHADKPSSSQVPGRRVSGRAASSKPKSAFSQLGGRL
jgi:eukaryotic-like serine/threonine-protein kinase